MLKQTKRPSLYNAKLLSLKQCPYIVYI